MNASTTQEFRSGVSLRLGFGAIMLCVSAWVSHQNGRTSALVVAGMLIIAAALVGLAWRLRRDPYVRLEPGSILLYQGGRVRQSISLDQIEGVSDGFNKSVVRLKNGSAVTIGHGEFRSRADCQAFKQALRDLLDSSVEVGSKK